ncbi:MAG: TonB-dependent receptor [Bacteroidota bacterium]|nr:TonB-dependent receptor [Bacteroidota bacterium]
MLKNITCVLAAIIISVFASAQTATIRGTVNSESSGEAVLFALVYLEGTTMGVQTDVNGFYSLTKIPAGTYTLVAQQGSYAPTKIIISVNAGDIVTRNIVLKVREMVMVEISADRQERQENPGVGKNTMDVEAINRVVAIGGVADIAQSVSVLPGVVSTGDQGGQLYIRGGTPVQNKVLLDGMIIYNPFHSIGLFSVFDTDIIKNLDVYTGGFSADYGGRVSSIMDITTRDGNRKRFGGKITVSPFGAKLMVEGPIRRIDSLETHGAITYVFSAKNSYLRQSSKVLYGYANEDKLEDGSPAGLPFNFSDYYGKIAFNSLNGSKLNVFGFLFNDTVARYKGAADLGWKSRGFGSNFQVVPGNSTTLIRGNFAYSNYDIGMKEDNYNDRSSSIDGFNLGLNFTYFQRKNVVNYGIEVLGFKTKFSFENAVRRTISQEENTTEMSAYIKYKWISGNIGGKKDSTANHTLVLEPGFRVQYYATLAETSPEPRLGFKYNINNHLRLKGATGMYSQNLLSATSDRDVVNLFYGFLSGSDNIPNTFVSENGKVYDVTSRLQKANHYIFGIEWNPIDSVKKFGEITFNIEGYLKDFRQLTNLNRNKLYEDDQAHANEPDMLKKDFIIETGKAYGVDFLVKYEYKNFYFWGVYSLGFVTRWDGLQSYRPNFDRRHNINIVTSYVFGKKENWEVDFRWNLGTGFPFTPTGGFYESLQFNNITTDYTTQNGQLGILYGNLNSHQLPTYSRLDATIKRTWEFSATSKFELALSVTNAYNRKNVFYFDRVAYKRVNQLPVMPSLSVNWTF